MIENIVFDMGNVLISFEPERYAEQFADAPSDQKILCDELFASYEWVAMDRGTMTEEDVIRGAKRRLPPRLHEAAEKLMAYWPKDMPQMPGMGALIRDLKAAGYPIYLLSNTSPQYRNFRSCIPEIDRFDGEFLSFEEKLLKPDPEIFERFCRTYGLEPGTCFFIDDRPDNIESARRVGMKGSVFHQDAERLRAVLKEAGILPRRD